MKRENQPALAYIFLTVSLVAAVFGGWLLTPILGKTSIYLLFILIVTANSWLGGKKPSFIAGFATSLTAALFFLLPLEILSLSWLTATYELGMYVISTSFLSLIIEKYRKTDLIAQHTKEEITYKKHLQKLEAETEKMRKEIKLRDEFLSIASHELKTPLTSMLLRLQSGLHNIRNVSLANFSVANLLKLLETAEQQTKRLSKMINDLLNISLITTGKLNLEKTEENLTALVEEVADEFSEKLEREKYTFKFEGKEKITCFIDKLRMEQVITNLMSNAIKYGNGKPIEVRVAKYGSRARITIKDHGIGIRDEQKEKIFELFERGVTNNGIKGLGVGLFIANQIVKTHGGSISVDSKPNHGATFTVEIPLKQK